MRTFLALQIATLLLVSTTSMAATVEYQDPNLTIVAKQEPLDAVLKSLGKEMRIYITVPTGLNPVVNCDIQQQPIKQAFKTLLGDMSYSLEWEEKTGHLVGLTILAAGEWVAAASEKLPHSASAQEVAPVAVARGGNQGSGTPAVQITHGAPTADHEAAMAEHEARMETERAEHEARMETEREEREVQMAEERVAHEERMKEEVVRHEAETEAYLEENGINPGQ